MGLDTSHDCWHGSYGGFMGWRKEIARAAGLPPLEFMEGFYRAIPNTDYQDPLYWANKGLNDETAFADLRSRLPIKWDCLKESPLHLLLYHSDCDGELRWEDCDAIADALADISPRVAEHWKDSTRKFIKGLRLAAKQRENVIFG